VAPLGFPRQCMHSQPVAEVVQRTRQMHTVGHALRSTLGAECTWGSTHATDPVDAHANGSVLRTTLLQYTVVRCCKAVVHVIDVVAIVWCRKWLLHNLPPGTEQLWPPVSVSCKAHECPHSGCLGGGASRNTTPRLKSPRHSNCRIPAKRQCHLQPSVTFQRIPRDLAFAAEGNAPLLAHLTSLGVTTVCIAPFGSYYRKVRLMDRPTRDPPAPPLSHPLTLRPTKGLARSLCHSLITGPTDSIAHSLTHSLTHSITHSLTHPLTHSLTHSLARCRKHPMNHRLAHARAGWQAWKHKLRPLRLQPNHPLAHTRADWQAWKHPLCPLLLQPNQRLADTHADWQAWKHKLRPLRLHSVKMAAACSVAMVWNPHDGMEVSADECAYAMACSASRQPPNPSATTAAISGCMAPRQPGDMSNELGALRTTVGGGGMAAVKGSVAAVWHNTRFIEGVILAGVAGDSASGTLVQ
jgi:hypothetical protein